MNLLSVCCRYVISLRKWMTKPTRPGRLYRDSFCRDAIGIYDLQIGPRMETNDEKRERGG